MALVIVPPDAAPGDLIQSVGGPSTCDIGPSRENPSGGWVQVTITPSGDSAVAPDASGRYLHCLWQFARARVAVGRRRENVASYQPIAAVPTGEIEVETDPGWFWVGSRASIRFLGGRPLDRYEVSVQESTPYDMIEQLDNFEPAFRFSLTSYFVVNGELPFAAFPAIPQYHSCFEVVAGQAQIFLPSTDTIPLNPGVRIPASMTGLQVSTGVYRTRGAF